jgi:mercuric ion transport protein
MASDATAREPATASSAPALTLAGVAALLASTCCVLPLAFALVGISGAWIAQLRVMQPWSVPLSVLAFALLGLAGWRLYRPSSSGGVACAVDDRACAQASAATRRWFWLVAVLTLVPVLVPLAAPLFY